jgi:bacillithiol system protein YtxJ
MKRLDSVEALNAFLQEHSDGEVFIFKRSTRCPVSSLTFEEFKRFAEKHPDVPTAYIDVIESRPVSNHFAEEHGVEHKSPQVIQLHHGDVAWHDSHNAITEEELTKRKKS